jgi:hypothetical protein
MALTRSPRPISFGAALMHGEENADFALFKALKVFGSLSPFIEGLSFSNSPSLSNPSHF